MATQQHSLVYSYTLNGLRITSDGAGSAEAFLQKTQQLLRAVQAGAVVHTLIANTSDAACHASLAQINTAIVRSNSILINKDKFNMFTFVIFAIGLVTGGYIGYAHGSRR